jgi:wyosine [tRNA(Phe)-imidazoG37] synthetase (radical SAM superfamily)
MMAGLKSVSAAVPQQHPREKSYKYLFGPVPSRRFGRSLGVDLIPFKTCSFDCVFCEVGATTRRTITRRRYVPIRAVLTEIHRWLSDGGKSDYITLAGSGEPTLHPDFGRLLEDIRKICSARTALLTNSSLLWRPAVRAGAAKADLVKVSLSAWDKASFEAINRPDPIVSFEQVIEGLRAFRSEFHGQLWLEVIAVAGFNDSDKAMTRIARLARSFSPDRIHLNTVVRPPAERVSPVPVTKLKHFAALFTPKAEVITEFKPGLRFPGRTDDTEIMAMLRRRPCSMADIVEGLGANTARATECIGRLVKNGNVRKKKLGTRVYYICD